MQSAGNDIIALDLIDKKRSNDSRFYSKILSGSEKKYYRQSPPGEMAFEYFLWLCWSVKESAYKYLKRIHPGLIFSPSGIIIQKIEVPVIAQVTGSYNKEQEGNLRNEKCYSGSFTAEGNIYYFRSGICPELITTVVNEDENFEHTYWDFGSINETDTDHQSKAVRSLFLKKLHTVLPGKELRVAKAAAGYPVVMDGIKELDIPVSFAHHGRFVGYSFQLPPQ